MIMDNQREIIGVFFCSCGLTLNDYFDMRSLEDYASRLPLVKYIDKNRFLCSKSGLDWLKAKIRQSGCNHIVIVGCSPQLCEGAFMKCAEESGLNPYSISIANIREGCAWVGHTKDYLMTNAKNIIESAVKRSAYTRPIQKVKKPVNPSVLVIGAGIAGVQTALELYRLGIRPIIVEKNAQVIRENPVFLIPMTQQVNARDMFSGKIKELRENNIELLTSTEIKDVQGNLGSFRVTLDNMGREKLIEVGAIVVSTGFRRQGGERISSLKASHRIVSLSQLRDMFDFDRKTLERILVTPDKRIKYVCFILGESEGSPKTTTIMALNEAIALKEQFKAEVIIAAKDITVSGTELEPLYRLARERGVIFVRYLEARPPEFTIEKGIITIRLKEPALSETCAQEGDTATLSVSSDLLVLEDEILPNESTEALSGILKVNVNQWGFLQGENVHLQHNLSNRKGIFFAGSCLGEEDIYETLNDVRSVTLNLYTCLSEGYLEIDKKVEVDSDKCVLCLTCFRSCPHKAIEIVDIAAGQGRGAQIIAEACQACGICTSECPAKAIEMIHFSDNQIFAELMVEG